MARGRSSRETRGGGARRVWLILGLVVFVVADGALVTGALAATHAHDYGAPHAIPTFSASVAAVATQTPSPTATKGSSTPGTTSASSDTVSAAPRILVAVSATEAWRSTRGDCSGPDAVLEHTTDGGATWSVASTAQYGIHTIAGLDANAALVRVVGGVGSVCTTAASQSYTAGRFWASYSLTTGNPAYLDAKTRSLALKVGVEKAPCAAPLTFAESSTGAAVLCTDGLYVQPKSAAWSPLAVPGALALAADGAGFTVAANRPSSCHGVAILTLATASAVGSTVRQLGCAPVADPTGVTIAQQSSALWMWAGSSVIVSADGGATWG